MTANEIRKKFLEFLKDKGHTVILSASLVPQNDPTVLFTTAGMHPLVPYLLGEPHPGGKRLVNFQKSLRTDDIDEVGDSTHNTFFEMLGNWSLGDYWKKEAIGWSYEFLIDKKWLGLDPKKLAVSVFAGDNDAPRDDESVEIWKRLGISDQRIAYLPKKDNWWGPAGMTGPCGPDTEMFYWTGEGTVPKKFDADDARWVEIWNDVFMQYNKTADGKFEPLRQKNVDTGMGLERMTAVMEGKESIWETELFVPILEKIRGLAKKQDAKSERIIADHLRAATFIISDGVVPSNKERGYILRRLIRRAIVHGKLVGIEDEFSTEIAEVVIHEYSPIYPELKRHREKIIDELGKEDTKFRKTLRSGLDRLERVGFADQLEMLPEIREGEAYPVYPLGMEIFNIFQTYGIPLEVAVDYLRQKNIKFDYETIIRDYNEAYERHQRLSRTSTMGVFKGGLADHSERTTRLHTATHLLQAGLRHILGEHLFQRGSHITAERTRFDFNHPQKVTEEELRKVEDWVNEQVRRDWPVKREWMTPKQAHELGAIGLFDEKYEDKVSVYTIHDPKTGAVISREFCGGPHVEHTGLVGEFKILKEEAVGAGIRRIKATVV